MPRPAKKTLSASAKAPGAKILYGMVHVAALPGTPRSTLRVDKIARQAAAEARVLMDAGFDGVIVENMHDVPYVHPGLSHPGAMHGPEVVSAMTRCVLEVRAAIGDKTQLGVQVLSG